MIVFLDLCAALRVLENETLLINCTHHTLFTCPILPILLHLPDLSFTTILSCRYNCSGVNELVVALEQVGAGGDVLLREASQRPSTTTAAITQR